jgi:hypothetical protein
MNRCSKCLLPDSLAGSNFNSDNKCSWCQTNYPNYLPKGEAELRKVFAKIPSKNGSADCLVGLSGGKDSTYALHRLVKDYGLKAEAFTYVHDGTTAFSVDNAKQTCQKLGVKHHLVSLPNSAHLKSFKSYFKAWLESPTTVSAGMTCVACKHLHLLGLDIAKQNKIPMIVWSSSPLEYSPFLAIKYIGDSKNPFKRQSTVNSGLLLVKELLKSPKFLSALIRHLKLSYLGCLAVFPTCKYLAQRYSEITPIMFYDYENWNPNLIRKTIRDELSWKTPGDVQEDWHSDCLFNVFKEYMFQKMFGVSYTDAHLSNQIRFNYITREEAVLQLAQSKKQFAAAIPKAMNELGLNHLMDRVDLSCFEVDIT